MGILSPVVGRAPGSIVVFLATPRRFRDNAPRAAVSEMISVNSCDAAVLEMREGGAGNGADLAGA